MRHNSKLALGSSQASQQDERKILSKINFQVQPLLYIPFIKSQQSLRLWMSFANNKEANYHKSKVVITVTHQGMAHSISCKW